MMTAWPALCTGLALVLLLALIIRYQLQAFVALLVASLALGLAAGLPPTRVLNSIAKGVGGILADVAVILALGAMLGRMLDTSGAAAVIANTLVRAFGEARASLAILVAAYLIGIPVLFNVGFLLLIPIMWQLQRQTGQSLLWFLLPLHFSLGITHSLIPPHPGIVGAVVTLGGAAPGTVMIETIVFGTLLGIPMVLIGWLGPGRWWAKRQMVTVPEALAAPVSPVADKPEVPGPSFAVCVMIVVLPLLLSLLGFGAKLLSDLGRLPSWVAEPVLVQRGRLSGFLAFLQHTPLDWLLFLGHPTMALLVPTGLAFWLLGQRRGLGRAELSRIAGNGLQDVGGMVFLFGAAGGFKQVIQDSGAGDAIAGQVMQLPLSPVLVAYLVAVLMRLALGSATAAILTASAVLAGLSRSLPGQETLLVLAVANGVTFATQPADSGFWLMKEYGNLSVRDVLIRLNACRIIMSLSGLGLLLAVATWLR
jgi:Gnt-I system low-affinity gluconate transporter